MGGDFLTFPIQHLLSRQPNAGSKPNELLNGVQFSLWKSAPLFPFKAGSRWDFREFSLQVKPGELGGWFKGVKMFR